MSEMLNAGPDAGAAPVERAGRAFKWNKSPELRKYTVFLVEDDNADRNVILQTLQRSPHVPNVHWFDSGDRMLNHFVAEGFYAGALQSIPTIILLDVVLPGSGGIEVLKRLKQNPLTSEIPVMMLTTEMEEDAAKQIFKLKANAYVTKPLQLDRIHEVMFRGWSWPVPPFRGA